VICLDVLMGDLEGVHAFFSICCAASMNAL